MREERGSFRRLEIIDLLGLELRVSRCELLAAAPARGEAGALLRLLGVGLRILDVLLVEAAPSGRDGAPRRAGARDAEQRLQSRDEAGRARIHADREHADPAGL